MDIPEELQKLIDEAAADAEAVQELPDDGAPLPDHVTVTQPGLQRSLRSALGGI